MAKITVVHQSYFDHPALGNESIGVTRVKINDATTNHLPLAGGLIEARPFQETRGTAVPTFYIGGAGNNNHLAIDGATVGNTYTVISRHLGPKNVGDDR
jgi:hypothetical protein